MLKAAHRVCKTAASGSCLQQGPLRKVALAPFQLVDIFPGALRFAANSPSPVPGYTSPVALAHPGEYYRFGYGQPRSCHHPSDCPEQAQASQKAKGVAGKAALTVSECLWLAVGCPQRRVCFYVGVLNLPLRRSHSDIY